jgi:hypothetical protein
MRASFHLAILAFRSAEFNVPHSGTPSFFAGSLEMDGDSGADEA